jgi:nicotinate (nicotinamide) nucleotide adenylyltransferase
MEVIAAPSRTSVLAVLCGSFHPVTRAHMALAHAALECCDGLLFVMPRRFPHKSYGEVTLEQRIETVRLAVACEARFGVAVTEGGLFREIAAEIRAALSAGELWFVCGRDAAERIVAWDYGEGPGIAEQLRQFGLLVADRQGGYRAPPDLTHRVRRIAMAPGFGDDSATEVRRRIGSGQPWEHLVPEAVVDRIRRLWGKP